MRLATFRRDGQGKRGAFVDADCKIARLQAAEQLRSGRPSPDLSSMLAFLQGGAAARDEAQAALEYALSQNPKDVLLERRDVELMAPMPRPESIREFMTFEQHIINCVRRVGLPRWIEVLDEWVHNTFGQRAG